MPLFINAHEGSRDETSQTLLSEGLETKLHAARIVVPIPRCVTTLFWDIL